MGSLAPPFWVMVGWRSFWTCRALWGSPGKIWRPHDGQSFSRLLSNKESLPGADPINLKWSFCRKTYADMRDTFNNSGGVMFTKLMSLPIWVRLVGSVMVVIGAIVVGLTFWSVREQERIAISQASSFGAGSVQVIASGISALMMTGNSEQLDSLLHETRKNHGIDSLKLIRGDLVTKQYGSGAKGKLTIDTAEQRVLSEGRAYSALETTTGKLLYRAVVPVVAAGGAQGRGCTSCHQAEEGSVLGAISIGIGLEHLRQSTREFQRNVFFGAGALGLLLGLGCYLLVSRTISRPLQKMVLQMKDISEGEGDLTRTIEVKSRDEIGQLASSFNIFVGKIHDIVVQVKGIADHVAAGSSQLSAASEQLSSGAQQQASSLEETAASLEEITGTVKQNADNARQANQLAVGSRDMAEKGGEVVSDAVDAMGEINRSSKKIADIITTIDEIAFQTNLLALNAAVEAARAGEQGRGFAVVAAEVRNLAQRSATAAKEIKTLIQDSVAKVDVGSELVNKSGQTLAEIVTSVKRVTDIVGEIAAASQEQSSGIDQINTAVTQMDQVTQSNAAQTEELSSTAQSLASQAHQIQALVARFKLRAGDGSALASSVSQVVPAVVPAQHSVNSKVRSRKAQPNPQALFRGNGMASLEPGNGSAKGSDSGFEEF
ncbi:MAG: HAMP domain-containing protein [Deltaproteobacteria bacterium]|nr:HAMP domain-containing protein [Deltaproteobacteria bacterium]